MLAPFLFEIRTIIDWFFIKSSLSFSEWVKVEAIYAKVYWIKCERYFDDNRSTDTRGQSLPRKRKLFFAAIIFAFLMFSIWFPLLFFAYIEALGESQAIAEASFSIQFGSHEPFYTSSSVESNIHQFTEDDMSRLNQLFGTKHPDAVTFLKKFDAADVVAVTFNKFSSKMWDLPPPTLASIKYNMAHHRSRYIHTNFRVVRGVGTTGKDTINEYKEMDMTDDLKDDIAEMLDENNNTTAVVIPYIFKKFNLIRNVGKFEKISQLSLDDDGGEMILISIRNN